MTLAFALTATVGVILGFLRPLTNYEYKTLVYTVIHTLWDNTIESGTFVTGLGDYTFTVDSIADDGRRLSGVFLYKAIADGSSTTVYAREGTVYHSTFANRLILRLEDGTQVNADTSHERATVITFNKLDIPIDLPSSSEGVRQRGTGGAGEFTILELWRLLDEPLEDVVHIRVESEIHGRVVRTLSVLVLPFLGAAVGLASRPRQHRIGPLAGFLFLVFYHYMLQLAQGLANNGGAAPWIAYWVPFAMFTCVGVWAFHETVARPGYNPLMATFDRFGDMMDFLSRRVAKRRDRVTIQIGGWGGDASSSSTTYADVREPSSRH